MRLSIIVPVYNMAADDKLKFCMDSLVSQTLPPEAYEIIAVDDASTDNSVELLEEYAVKYPNVKLIRHEQNKRQGGAKNTGMREASGEWIGFIDSDDWITPDFYEKLLARADETGADVVGCDYNLVHEHTFDVGETVKNNDCDQTGVLDDERHKRLILRSGSMVIKIYKKEVLDTYHLEFPEGIFYEDNCAGPLWSMYFKHFEKVEEPMYYYYQHDVSTVHRITEEKCNDRMEAAALFYAECSNRGFLDKYREEIEYRFTELFYVNTLFSYMSGVNKPRLKYVKKMRNDTLNRFPEFDKNKYYREYTGEEEKKLISIQLKSNLLFFVYYRAKLLWRTFMRPRNGD